MGAEGGDPYMDRARPCPCPPSVIEELALAVCYAQATGGNSDFVRGAEYVKMLMEQPAECWCAFIDVREVRHG